MKKFFSALAAGAKAMTSGPAGEPFEVAGRPVRCPHCGGERFVEGRAQLNTAGLTFLNLDWANRSAATLACVGCGRLEWFLADPEERAQSMFGMTWSGILLVYVPVLLAGGGAFSLGLRAVRALQRRKQSGASDELLQHRVAALEEVRLRTAEEVQHLRAQHEFMAKLLNQRRAPTDAG